MVKTIKAKKSLFGLIAFLFLESCGTLGGFEPITLPVSKQKVEIAIDSLYMNFPEYRIPDKWKTLDDWKERGYGFLDSRIFYFKSLPKEMYYVSFVGDSTSQNYQFEASMSVRAVSIGDERWLLNDDVNSANEKRINKRFKEEIISKLKYYLKVP